MKPILRLTFLLLTSSIFCFNAQAQDEIGEFLKESVDDGEKLVGAYISPMMNSISSGLNQGWYNTAKPHKIAGVDITATVNAMSIPKDQLFYNAASLGLKKIEMDPTSPDYQSTSKQMAPTIFGPGEGHEPIFRSKSEFTETFEGPAGLDPKGEIGINFMPVPMIQIGFGLPKGTDLKVRYLPSLSAGDNVDFNMFGVGVMHDVKQWIPVMKDLPFDLSGFAGYTKFKMNAKFEDPDIENGKGIFEMSAFTLQGVISKKVSVLTVYGGLGYNVAKSKLAMLGTYTLGQDPITNEDITAKDPVDLSFAASGPRVTAGFRLKLAVLTIHTDYTIQKYSCLTVGLGISVR